MEKPVVKKKRFSGLSNRAIQVTVTQPQFEKIEQYAYVRGLSYSDVCRMAIVEFFNNKQNQQ